MSESFSEPTGDERTAEPDVETDAAQVEPGSDAEYVGRVQGTDEGYAGETGAEARSEAARREDDPRTH